MKKTFRQLHALIEWFIPQGIKADIEGSIRAKQLVIFCLIGPLFFIPNIIKWKSLGSNPLALSMAAVMVIVICLSFALRYFRSLTFYANAVFAVLTWHFIFLPYSTGGIHSSALTWNLVIPVFAAAFAGIRASIFWTAVMLIEVGVFFYFNKAGIVLPQIELTESQILETQIANILGPLLAIGLTMFFSDKGRQHAYEARNKAQTQAMMSQEKSESATKRHSTELQQIFVKIQDSSVSLNQELEKISTKIKENAKHSEQADQLMKKSDHVIVEAQDSMRELTASMEKITAASENTSNIIKTIDEIAFQTNLLALNAAVEAARAGEVGAGFSVVADEVRNLALRSAEAAKNTTVLLKETDQTISNGSDLVASTNEAFMHVEKSVRTVAELITGITSSSHQQAGGITQIDKTVAEMLETVSKTRD